ncbi:hypothetical protein CAEBREN_30932 [Caenorhabditis brenneri]|uniref:Uncharacterized protein n=1 Tax=Caenorhabditis brenneri TaxID=135651 RepID=G0M811_CAEBE|nr:hypothetical protein CAEBREN_30932 [Caenorhabditis brenneri]
MGPNRPGEDVEHFLCSGFNQVAVFVVAAAYFSTNLWTNQKALIGSGLKERVAKRTAIVLPFLIPFGPPPLSHLANEPCASERFAEISVPKPIMRAISYRWLLFLGPQILRLLNARKGTKSFL